jgi:uncharacterized RDD family membrane protein YckC
MADDTSGTSESREADGSTNAAPPSYPGSSPPSFPGSAPPSYPGNAPPPPFPPPPVPPPPSGPPSYPTIPSGGYAPPTQYGMAGGPPYASWGIRLGGYLIDFVVFIPVFVVLAILFRHSHTLDVHFAMRTNGTRERRTFSLLSLLVTGVVYLVYATVLCGGRRGQTVGMMAVGIRVVRDGTHDVVGYGRAFVRALVEQVFRLLGSATIILGLIWLLDMLFPIWDKKRQTLHDKITRTVVLRVRNVA